MNHLIKIVFINFILFTSCAAGNSNIPEMEKNLPAKKEKCNPGESSISETDFELDNNGNPIVWPKDADIIPVVISPDFSTKERNQILNSAYLWNKKIEKKVLFPIIGSDNNFSYIPNTIKIIKTQLSKNCGNQQLGLAYKKTKTNKNNVEYIYSATIKLHPDSKAEYEYNRVAMHEIGHALGLEHDSNNQSLMYPTILSNPWVVEEKDLHGLKEGFGIK